MTDFNTKNGARNTALVLDVIDDFWAKAKTPTWLTSEQADQVRIGVTEIRNVIARGPLELAGFFQLIRVLVLKLPGVAGLIGEAVALAELRSYLAAGEFDSILNEAEKDSKLPQFVGKIGQA